MRLWKRRVDPEDVAKTAARIGDSEKAVGELAQACLNAGIDTDALGFSIVKMQRRFANWQVQESDMTSTPTGMFRWVAAQASAMDCASRAAFVVDIFGKSGVDLLMLPMFRGGK